MATANFNTIIESSQNQFEILTYVLSEVIDTDFPVLVYILNKAPLGVIIDGNELSIPSNTEFILSITIIGGGKVNPIEVQVYTKVILKQKTFVDRVDDFLKNKEIESKITTTKNNWSDIINPNNVLEPPKK